jgi:flagellar hook assembly protein FlgD
VSLKVYNLLGKEVATLVKGEKQAGRYAVTFDGSRLASGEYIVRMQSGNYSKTIKILLMK